MRIGRMKRDKYIWYNRKTNQLMNWCKKMTLTMFMLKSMHDVESFSDNFVYLGEL